MSLNQKITKAVALWPKDELRPWLSFPKTLDTSIRARLQKMPPQQANKQLNALNNLLDNVYWNKVCFLLRALIGSPYLCSPFNQIVVYPQASSIETTI